MSDLTDRHLRRGLTWKVETDPAGLRLPHRVTKERREQAEARVVAAADWIPSWAAQPTLGFRSAVPPENEAP